MDKVKLSPANIVILVGGVVMLIASFLPFYSFASVSKNSWSSGNLLIATLPALLGIAMAVVVGLVSFAPGVNLPENVLGLSWDQILLVLGFQATIMMLAFLIRDTGGLDKGIGLWLMLLAAIALLVGAILRTREAASAAPPPAA